MGDDLRVEIVTEQQLMNRFGRTYQPTAVFGDDRPSGEVDLSWDGELAEAFVEDVQRDTERMEDSVQIYLREIGQVALLTAADEHTLAEEILRGHAARASLQHQAYHTWNDRLALERDLVRGDEARRR